MAKNNIYFRDGKLYKDDVEVILPLHKILPVIDEMEVFFITGKDIYEYQYVWDAMARFFNSTQTAEDEAQYADFFEKLEDYYEFHADYSETLSRLDIDNLVAEVHLDPGQTIADATDTTVAYNVKDRDAFGMFNSVTGELNCIKNGDYEVTGNISFFDSATGIRRAQLLKNGVLHRFLFIVSPAATGLTLMPVSMVATGCVMGDKLSIQVFQDSGGPLDLRSAPGENYLVFTRIPNS